MLIRSETQHVFDQVGIKPKVQAAVSNFYISKIHDMYLEEGYIELLDEDRDAADI